MEQSACFLRRITAGQAHDGDGPLGGVGWGSLSARRWSRRDARMTRCLLKLLATSLRSRRAGRCVPDDIQIFRSRSVLRAEGVANRGKALFPY